MSISGKLTALLATKEAIKNAIIGKGVTVNDAEPLSGYAAKISAIKDKSDLAVSIPNVSMTCILKVMQTFTNSSTLQVTAPDAVLVTNVTTGTHIDAPITITTAPPAISLTTSVTAQ